MATIKKTIPYKELPLKMRLCFKPYKKADGTHELCFRWWYALYFGIKFAFNVCFEVQEIDEMDEIICEEAIDKGYEDAKNRILRGEQ